MQSVPQNYLKVKITSELSNQLTKRTSGNRPLLAAGYSLERVIEDIEAIHEIGRLRVAVWNHAQPQIRADLVKEGMWLESLDYRPNTEHWIVRHKGKVVASCRISFHTSTEGVPDSNIMAEFADSNAKLYSSINRLVIHHDHLKKGLSYLLDHVRLYSAKRKGSTQLFAYAVGEKRSESLAKLGFQKHAENHGLAILPTIDGPYFALSLDPSKSQLNGEINNLYLQAASDKKNHS